jgi:hypothetical protein
VTIPRCAPTAAILWPVHGMVARTGDLLRLWGTATDDGITLPPECLRWYLDGEPVGTGYEVWVPSPEWEGEHRATLKVGDAPVTPRYLYYL